MSTHFSGQVVKHPVATGSKSEHDAVMLETKAGTFVLRRTGGNAFADPELDRLIGKHVTVVGELHDHILIVSDYREATNA